MVVTVTAITYKVMRMSSSVTDDVVEYLSYGDSEVISKMEEAGFVNNVHDVSSVSFWFRF